MIGALAAGIGLTVSCATIAALGNLVEAPDPYCPLVRGERVDLEWAPAERRDLLKTGSACTTVLGRA